jgi:hypothetical protein
MNNVVRGMPSTGRVMWPVPWVSSTSTTPPGENLRTSPIRSLEARRYGSAGEATAALHDAPVQALTVSIVAG